VTRARARLLAGALGVVFGAVVVAAVVVLPQLGTVTTAVALLVLLHVLGYLALGILLLTLGPRQAERLKAWLARRRKGRAKPAGSAT
jgi:hypothetical protein